MIVRLTKDTDENIEALGGKGCGLVRLLRAGLPVPAAWCVPAGVYKTCDGKISPELESELRLFWNDLKQQESGVRLAIRLAVRSSATAEDLEEASFAGVYRTVLGVKTYEELIDAVKTCRDALHTESARAYREERGLGHDAAIAVVIQRLLSPTAAGVLLTANPARPFAREFAVDASWGLGEAVVSGRVDPDHITLDRETGEAKNHRVGSKEIELILTPEGKIGERPVEAERREKLCLTDTQIRKLFELAENVEKRIGPRQDVEWAFEGDRLFVLQQRPVTGLPPERPEVVWSRIFGDEYLADYMMPLSDSMLVRWIREDYLEDVARLQGREDVAGLEPIRRYNGYAYMNGLYIARMLRAVPKGTRSVLSLGWFPPDWEERIAAEPFQPLRLWKALRSFWLDPRAHVTRNEKALARHCGNIDRAVVPKLRQDYAGLSESEWRRQFEEAYELGREHFRIIRWGMGFHNPVLHGLLTRVLTRRAGDGDGELYRAIISGLPGTRTAGINRDVWRLGRAARADAEAAALFAKKKQSYEEARKASAGSPFWRAFDDFVARHGHRAATREIALPRWRETPDAILGLVRAQLRAKDPPPDPETVAAESVRRREEAEREALGRAARGLFGFLWRRALTWLFRTTQAYTRYRENQRYHLDYILTHIRALVLERGRRLAERGILNEPSEVFFLEADEFWGLVDEPVPSAGLRDRLDERREHYLKWKDRLPATYLYDDVEVEAAMLERGAAAGSADGLGASGGRASGPARVVAELARLEEVEPGDILVAGNIDPGWTNVFPMLAGLVTETGGLLSHGAILAREYGIPAVMGVKDACRKIQTGDTLEIDGSAGTIHTRPLSNR